MSSIGFPQIADIDHRQLEQALGIKYVTLDEVADPAIIRSVEEVKTEMAKIVKDMPFDPFGERLEE